MNKHDFIDFLRDHQPLPDFPNEALMQSYRSAMAYFFENPDPQVIPLFLGSFSQWEDWLTYEAVQHIVRQFPREQVLPHIYQSLYSKHFMVIFWNIDLLRYFPSVENLEHLKPFLKNNSPEIRLAAAAALEVIDHPSAQLLASQHLFAEDDNDIRDVYMCILKPNKNN